MHVLAIAVGISSFASFASSEVVSASFEDIAAAVRGSDVAKGLVDFYREQLCA